MSVQQHVIKKSMKNILLLFILLFGLQFSLTHGAYFVSSKNKEGSEPKIITTEQDDDVPLLENSEALTGNIIPFDTTIAINKITPDQILFYTNQERTKRGIAPIKINKLLNFSTYEKLNDMRYNKYFSHTSPKEPGRSFIDFVEDENYDFLRVSENLAFGYFNSASEVVNEWMNSKQHRTNILYSEWEDIGISVYQNSDGTYYIVQHFGIQKKRCPEIDQELSEEIKELETSSLILRREISKLEEGIIERGESFDLSIPEDEEMFENYNITIKKYNTNVEQYTELIYNYNREVERFKSCMALVEYKNRE